MKIALIQMNSVADKAANIAQARELIERAVDLEKPDWVLLPEHFDWSGGGTADKVREAEEVGSGPASTMARELAAKRTRRHGLQGVRVGQAGARDRHL